MIQLFWRLQSPRTAEDIEALMADNHDVVDVAVDNWDKFKLIQEGHQVVLLSVDHQVFMGVVCEPNLGDPSNLVVIRITDRLE